MNIEINEQFKHALDLMENTRKNIFVTGRAGTGKSTLLNYFRTKTKKNVAFLAPTGVAALNIEGQTIHSFFRFKPDVTVSSIRKYDGWSRQLYQEFDAIVVDEISMVRSDLLDCVDKFLRLNRNNLRLPFGGMQMILIGDLYQLPPVVVGEEKNIFKTQYKSQYFFDAKVFENFEMEFIELEKIYRQRDNKFIEILNSIRNNSVTEEQLASINGRLNPGFEISGDDFYIQLTPTNKLSAEINTRELSRMKGKLFEYRGKTKGNFAEHYLPTDVELKLKIGSQIMLVNNDPMYRWVNGNVGKIVEIESNEKDDDTVIVELSDKGKVAVKPFTWKVFELFFNPEMRALDSRTIGSFRQYPIKLAWSVTIHKGQGKTFDRVIIDIGKGTFTHGQVYVALSRCTSLGGVILRKPIQKKHIFMDWRIVNFLTRYQYKISDKKLSLNDKIKLIEKAIKNKSKLHIVYLKSNDQKSKRIIRPEYVGEMEYMNKSYVGVEGFCFERQDKRIFRVDRILEMKEV